MLVPREREKINWYSILLDSKFLLPCLPFLYHSYTNRHVIISKSNYFLLTLSMPLQRFSAIKKKLAIGEFFFILESEWIFDLFCKQIIQRITVFVERTDEKRLPSKWTIINFRQTGSNHIQKKSKIKPYLTKISISFQQLKQYLHEIYTLSLVSYQDLSQQNQQNIMKKGLASNGLIHIPCEKITKFIQYSLRWCHEYIFFKCDISNQSTLQRIVNLEKATNRQVFFWRNISSLFYLPLICVWTDLSSLRF